MIYVATRRLLFEAALLWFLECVRFFVSFFAFHFPVKSASAAFPFPE